MIILDASVLIAHLDESDAHHEAASELLSQLAEDTFGASPVTLAEALVGPAQRQQLGNAQTVLRTLDVESVPLGPDSPARLATLRAETKLKMPDCCVLLAAQDAAARAVATFDDRLRVQAAHFGLGLG